MFSSLLQLQHRERALGESRLSLLCPQTGLGPVGALTRTPCFPRPVVPAPLALDGPGADSLLLLSLSHPECSLISGRETSGPISMKAFPRGQEGMSLLAGQHSSKEPSLVPRTWASSVTGRAGRQVKVFGPTPTAPGWPCSETFLSEVILTLPRGASPTPPVGHCK